MRMLTEKSANINSHDVQNGHKVNSSHFHDNPPIPILDIDDRFLNDSNVDEINNITREEILSLCKSIVKYRKDLATFHDCVIRINEHNKRLFLRQASELAELKCRLCKDDQPGFYSSHDNDRDANFDDPARGVPESSQSGSEREKSTNNGDHGSPVRSDEITGQQFDNSIPTSDDLAQMSYTEIDVKRELTAEEVGEEFTESTPVNDEMFQLMVFHDDEANVLQTRLVESVSEENADAINKMLADTVGGLVCVLCRRSFRSIKTYDRHMQSHDPEISHECGKCLKPFVTADDLERHIRTHQPKYPCSKCPKRYNSLKQLHTHTETSHNIDRASLVCKICNKQFKYPIHLVKHARYHTEKIAESPPKNLRQFTKLCELCGRKFTHHSALREHMLSHSNRRDFPCDLCGKSFNRRQSMLNHKLVHSDVLPFKCQFCDMKFRRLGGKERHERVHTGARPFKCRYCDKAFSDGGIRLGHEKIHLGVKEYGCEICQMRFMFAEGLKKHMRTHTDERPYTCETCGKCFRRSNTLKKHHLVHTGERPLFCHICGKSYPRNLSTHMKTHLKEGPTKCCTCGESFYRVRHLAEHYKLVPSHAPLYASQ